MRGVITRETYVLPKKLNDKLINKLLLQEEHFGA